MVNEGLNKTKSDTDSCTNYLQQEQKVFRVQCKRERERERERERLSGIGHNFEIKKL